MAYNLEIKEEAVLDIIDGFLFYTKKANGLGERFVSEVEDVFGYISEFPEHFQAVYNEYRQRQLKSFPYLVIYKIIGKNVVVFSVFPAKSNPAKKPK